MIPAKRRMRACVLECFARRRPCSSSLAWWLYKVASPGLGGGQVAVLRPHVATSRHVWDAAYSGERGWRITRMHHFFLAQMDYLFAGW